MFEKVNPYHPDKVADRIAGAIVDLAYERQENPRIAVEVLIGHGLCVIIAESSVALHRTDVWPLVERIVGADADDLRLDFKCVPQDPHLAKNQEGEIRCGDNGIFAGYPVTDEQKDLTFLARELSLIAPHDGKYILSDKDLYVCHSHVNSPDFFPWVSNRAPGGVNIILNPLGDWIGGINTDSGATNRKLGSDMGDAVTGGGLHGKDLSKADVSVNIFCHLQAVDCGHKVTAHCHIGGTHIYLHNDIDHPEACVAVPYNVVVETARDYIKACGGFEKFAEWGLID